MRPRLCAAFAATLLFACAPPVLERPDPDGGAPPPGSDAGMDPEPRDAAAVDGHVTLPGADGGSAPADAGDSVAPTDCAALEAAGHSVCAAADGACEIVFYDGSGCNAACASAGMPCVASYRDDDDGAPLCARHPSGEAYACAETGHRSDYCVCGGTGAAPVEEPPDGLAFVGAEGFGATSRGGTGGRVYTVTNLNDSGDGSLRWAVERSGPRIVQFAVDGVIRLRSALEIRDPYITIDGRGALDPGEAGITIRDYPIDVRTHDVILRYFRVRLGDWAVLQRNAAARRSRPTNSNDLDCINIDQSSDVILDHMSLSWSADEIVSVTNSRNVTIQWSILSEPLGDPALHPYGDDHAYCANNSAATLSYHHDLFAHYRFRGPQFEANDMQDSSPRFDARFEAVNNVIYAYTSSGSRYRTGFERAIDRVTSVDFSYHFVANRYLDSSGRHAEIMAAVDFGAEPNIGVYAVGNIGPHRPRADMDELALVFTDSGASDPVRSHSGARGQVSTTPLFAPPVPVTVQTADDARDAVLESAGCSIERDAIDRRIVQDARTNAPARTLSSQDEVPEGWPTYR
ncbi:MAG: hypothetical protein H6719_26300 [Sandaracinaceae bacterium]|nr:hypothetical protein [Sandaracinaceae bacterium]